jgi:hypothetical protein
MNAADFDAFSLQAKHEREARARQEWDRTALDAGAHVHATFRSYLNHFADTQRDDAICEQLENSDAEARALIMDDLREEWRQEDREREAMEREGRDE